RRPGESEGTTIARTYALRIDLAKQLATLEQNSIATMEDSDTKRIAQARALADVTKQSAEAELDRTAKIADLRLKIYEGQRSFAGNLFDAALGGGSGLAGFARSQALGVGRTVFQNLATPVIHDIASH